MVRLISYSFSSDSDSTVCASNEKEHDPLQLIPMEGDTVDEKFMMRDSASQLSISTLVEVKDLEGNVTRTPQNEEPPQVLHP